MSAEVAAPEERWEAIVIGVDMAAPTATVRIESQPGPRRARIPKALELGTVDDPKIEPGDILVVQRDSRYRKLTAIQHVPRHHPSEPPSERDHSLAQALER